MSAQKTTALSPLIGKDFAAYENAGKALASGGRERPGGPVVARFTGLRSEDRVRLREVLVCVRLRRRNDGIVEGSGVGRPMRARLVTRLG
jgi:hypothetical protein